MNKFNDGQKVRVIKSYPKWLEVGDICTVTIADDGYNTVCVRTLNGRIGGFTCDHFEPVDDVMSMTDQQLSDEYRALTDQRSVIVKELKARGFTFSEIGSGRKMENIESQNIVIKKVETTIL